MKRSRASTPNAAMGPSILSIPQHILMEILSKLPMTTICNCRTYNPYVICNPVIDEYVIVPQMEKYSFDQRGSGLDFVQGLIGTNLWRRVRDAPLYLHSYSDGCFLNGALHWIIHDTENCFESIHCFDFGKERFQPFPGPSQFYRFLGQPRVDTMKMGVLKDHLSISHNPTYDMLDIWVMKDYAVQDSWTKDFVIKTPWVVKPFCGEIYQPLMVLINGDILMQFALSFLVSFNMRDKIIRKVEAKKAVPRGDGNTMSRSSSSIHGSPGPIRTRKIFVGGLASTVTESDFKMYFEQFGIITDVVVTYDHNTRRPRGFGFITYDSEDAVDKV
ncbi:hypothetical protein RHSIM_Rhsim04G0039900 [Rhododendron simsii]|uniref:RRM domain-containing protein n=1 Tax=Rhododendron simsii TaxID=118357 RepID=A0A834H2K6_RHOSS|nr:hypothetical protein RHSIM_Rhsim04G0039900 [Rhododendron simsii]